MSNEHFTFDSTLIEAWASLKSFKRKDGSGKNEPPDAPGNTTVNFHGEKRSNATHESTTDPEAKLYRKSDRTTAKLSFLLDGRAHGNRKGLLVDLRIDEANGRASASQRQNC